MKYKPKHSTLAKIWGRLGENAVFPVTPSSMDSSSWKLRVLRHSGPEEGEGDRVRAAANGTSKAGVESGPVPLPLS